MAVDKATRQRWVREDRQRRHSAGARLDQVVAEMSVIAEAAAASYGESDRVQPDSSPPPGAFSKNGPPIADETRAMLGRLADALEMEVVRIRGGGDPAIRRLSGLDRDTKNQLIMELKNYKPAGWVAFVFDVDKRIVLDLWKLGRERWEAGV